MKRGRHNQSSSGAMKRGRHNQSSSGAMKRGRHNQSSSGAMKRGRHNNYLINVSFLQEYSNIHTSQYPTVAGFIPFPLVMSPKLEGADPVPVCIVSFLHYIF